MAAIVFTDIQSCLGANAETLYNPGSPITDAWFTSGFIDMGTRPNGDNTSNNWSPDNSALKAAGFWNAAMPWVVIYPGVSHAATNTRVEISNFICMVYSNSQKNWVDLTSNDTKIPTSENSYNFNLLSVSGSADSRIEASGNVSYKLNGSKNPIKFSLNPKKIYGDDVGGIFITCDAKLVLDNAGGADDRASAHLLISVGANYMPSISNVDADFYPVGIPKVCGSKFSLITNTNKTFYSVPINPPGIVDISSNYSASGGRAHIDYDWFRTNFPRSYFARDVLSDAEFYLKLKTSIILDRGSATPTFSRASTATVFDHEGKLVTLPSGCVRFSGVNLATNTAYKNETLVNTFFTYNNITITSPFTDSLGGTKGLKMTATSASSPCVQSAGHPTLTALDGTMVCFSMDVKRSNWDWYAFYTKNSLGTKTAIQYFNTSTMTLGSATTSGGATIILSTLTPTADPLWYRINLTVQYAVGDAPQFQLRPVAANGSTTATGTSGSEILVAFFQQEGVERKSVKTSLGGYVSNGIASSPYFGMNVDKWKAFATDSNGVAIPESTIAGYTWDSIDKTNNLLYCRDFTNAAWVKTNITTTLNQTGICGIANNASLLTASATNGTVLQALTLKSEKRSSSAYVKRGVGVGSIYFTRDGGTTWTDITDLINSTSFTRVKIEGSSVLNPSIGFKIATNTDAIIVDYVQDEVGETATNPILTTSAIATRLADSLSYTTSGNINDTEGTILATIKRKNWGANKGQIIGYDYDHGISLSKDVTNSNVFVLSDGTNIAGSSAKKYNPGHYYQAYYNDVGAIQNWSNIITELTGHLYLQGVQLRYKWRDLETTDGVYNFSDIRSKINDLKSIGKRAIILIDLKAGLNGATILDTVPDYIKNGGSYGGGQFTYINAANPTGAGTNIRLWNTNVLAKFKSLFLALANEFDSNNLLEAVGISDSYPEQPLDGSLVSAGELKEPEMSNWFTNLLSLNTSAVAYFANTMIFQNSDYPRANLVSFIPSLISSGISLGCKNVMADEPTINGVASGADGAYEYFVSAKDVVGRFCTISPTDYDYCLLYTSPSPRD